MDNGLTFWLLGALFVLVGWVQYSVIRRAWRKRRSIFGRGPMLRYAICAVLLAAGVYSFVTCYGAFRDGRIYVAFYHRFASHGLGYTIDRADNPSGFFREFFFDSFFGLMTSCLGMAELMIGVRQKKHVSKRPSAEKTQNAGQ